MPFTLRRFAAYLLLVLLPFQAMASVLERSCADSMPHCHAMQAQMSDCCEHGEHSFATHKHGDMGASQNADHQQSSCGMSSTCAATASMMALPSANLVLPEANSDVPNAVILSSYTSFVPEGLQRPPRILA